MIPPRPIRRLLAPLWVALAGTLMLLSPVLALTARLLGRLTGSRQPRLLARFALLYFLQEAAVLVAGGVLWVASGFGAQLHTAPFQRAHYRLLDWFLSGLVREAERTLHLRILVEPSPEAMHALEDQARPLLLFSNHAGPGDSLLIVHLLLTRFGRHPRIVLKQALGLDPVIDLVTQRLPNALLDTSDPDRCRTQIQRVADGMDRRGVLVLFPEGGNFTPQRRRRAIAALRHRGRRRQARQAERMEHVMPPKPAGALAALTARPDADVLFVAHAGLGDAAFASQLLRELPGDRTLHARIWLAPAGERPDDEEGQIEWLFDWWKRMDAWIDAESAAPAR